MCLGRSKEFETIRTLLLPWPQSRDVVIVIRGVGGIGKTSLANKVVQYYIEENNNILRDNRFHAVVWFSAKKVRLTTTGIEEILPKHKAYSLIDLYEEIAKTMDFNLDSFRKMLPGKQEEEIIKSLEKNRTLIILDNMESVQDKEITDFLRKVPVHTKIIITTRHWFEDAHYTLRLKGLPESICQKLIEKKIGEFNDFDLDQLDKNKLIELSNQNPLLIEWACNKLASGAPAPDVFEQLSTAEGDPLAYIYKNEIEPLREDPSLAPAYHILMALTFFTRPVDSLIISKVSGYFGKNQLVNNALEYLVRRSLLTSHNGRYYSLSDLARICAMDEISLNSSFDTESFDRWVDLELSLETAEGDFKTTNVYWEAIQLIRQAKESILVLNALMTDADTIEDVTTYDTQLSLDERLENFIYNIFETTYYDELLVCAKNLIEYTRIIQLQGEIDEAKVGFNYLRHMHTMTQYSANNNSEHQNMKVLLYQARPVRNKTFLVIDNRYIVVQANSMIRGKKRMSGIYVLKVNRQDILKTFVTIFDHIVTKSTVATYAALPKFEHPHPRFSTLVYSRALQLFKDLFKEGKLREVKELISSMYMTENMEIKQLLGKVIKELLAIDSIYNDLADILGGLRDKQFSNWLYSTGLM